MTTRIFAPLLLAGAAAAAVAFAPTAAAGSSADCNDNGPAAVCTRPGHAAIYAEPAQRMQGYSIAPGVLNPFGSGPMPPLLAIG
ncbi:MAG: hypothetical protein ACKOQ4_14270 [Mycobacterium sp.]